MRFEHYFDQWNTLCTTQILENTIICIKFFNLYHLFVIFLQSETSLNFSNFDQQDFVKIQNFDGYDIIMM